jgi:hypothetical protein
MFKLAVAAVVASCFSLSATAAQTWVEWGPADTDGTFRVFDSTTPISRTNSYSNPTGSNGYATLTGYSTFGISKSSVSAHAGDGGGMGSFVNSVWQDSLTIDGGALNGTQGYATVALDYRWATSRSVTGLGGVQTDVHAGIDFAGSTLMVRQIQRNVCENVDGSCEISDTGVVETLQLAGQASQTSIATPARVTAVIPFTFGSGIPVQGWISAAVDAGANIGSFAAGSSDAGHSGYWGGLLGVTDGFGRAVTYSLSSESGTNYAVSFAPVPEPSALAMLVGGLLAVGARRRVLLRAR